MLTSRKIAVAGTIAALSLATAPIAAASTNIHTSPDRVQRVDKKSPDKKDSHDRNDKRDSKNHH